MKHFLRTTAATIAVVLAGPVPMTGAPAGPAPVEVTRDAATSSRIDARDQIDLSVRVSQRRFRSGRADWVVLARHDLFADALAASGLLADGPLLLTPGERLDLSVSDEIDRVLARGGRVYVTGGRRAISNEVTHMLRLRGYDVVRLAGAGRTETAVRIAEEIVTQYGEPAQVLIARADGIPDRPSVAWADAISAGAAAARRGLPLLLTNSATLDRAPAGFLTDHAASDPVLLGGEAALAVDVARQVGRHQRVAGADRAGTAAAVARRWFPTTNSTLLVNGHDDLGWAHGLIAAGLGADLGAPIVYVQRDHVPDTTLDFLVECRPEELALTAIGSTATISDPTLHDARALATSACQVNDHGEYAFTAINDDGRPVAWPSCETLRVEVNLAGSPAGASQVVDAVLAKVEAASGLTVRLEPNTTERLDAWDSDRKSWIEPDGRTYEPVLVNWPRDWSRTEALGMGGGASISSGGDRVYVSGVISLDPAMPAESLEAVLLHEFGHVLGLAHVNDDTQVMYPLNDDDRTSFASGDRQGLAELSRAGACATA